MDKRRILDEFYTSFNRMKLKDQEEFERVANKLLSVCFITNKKGSHHRDFQDYYFIEREKAVFQSYFKRIGWEVVVSSRHGVVTLVNHANYNRLNFKLHESIVLLIIRLLYEEKLKEVSELEQIVITLDDIHQKYSALDLKNRMMTRTELKSILSLFKRFNLIELIDRDVTQGDSQIIIYPTVLFAVKIENIDQIHSKIKTYQQGGEEYEEIDHDQVD